MIWGSIFGSLQSSTTRRIQPEWSRSDHRRRPGFWTQWWGTMKLRKMAMYKSGWWLSHPSEKSEFVNWDDDIPNIWENKVHVPNHQPEMIYLWKHSSFHSCVRLPEGMAFTVPTWLGLGVSSRKLRSQRGDGPRLGVFMTPSTGESPFCWWINNVSWSSWAFFHSKIPFEHPQTICQWSRPPGLAENRMPQWRKITRLIIIVPIKYHKYSNMVVNPWQITSIFTPTFFRSSVFLIPSDNST